MGFIYNTELNINVLMFFIRNFEKVNLKSKVSKNWSNGFKNKMYKKIIFFKILTIFIIIIYLIT